MPVHVNEDDDVTAYICDVCSGTIEPPSGAMCPVCGKIFCDLCLADHPLESIKVTEKGPDYKKYELMCSLCAAQWRKKHPTFMELRIDGYF